jgi:hypothetical protein
VYISHLHKSCEEKVLHNYIYFTTFLFKQLEIMSAPRLHTILGNKFHNSIFSKSDMEDMKATQWNKEIQQLLREWLPYKLWSDLRKAILDLSSASQLGHSTSSQEAHHHHIPKKEFI